MYAYLEARFGDDDEEKKPSAYGWIITVDHLDPEGSPDYWSGPGVCGPRRLSDEMEERLKAGEGTAFRLLDDDGEVYYEGLIIGPGDDYQRAPDECVEWEFAPLWDYGQPNAGCTEIQYRDAEGNWKTL